jgi:serine/threonine-protein kinase HipA
MNMRRLDVFVNDRPVGRLAEADDLWTFEYDPVWRDAADAFDLSPALPRNGGLHRDGATSRPVQWYFDNLLPEEALRGILAKEAALQAEDAFGLLAYYGAESAGALVLQTPDQPPAADMGLRPLSRPELSARIKNLPTVSLTHGAPKHMSLAGAQHKLLVVQQGNELYEPLAGTPSTHILKPDHPDHPDASYPASVMNEYFTMRLAAAAGLSPPRVQRLYVPQPVYLVERFDRIHGAEPAAIGRRHLIDTCQLLNKARSFKYTAANLDSLSAAVSKCRSRAAARLQIYRWLVFNLLVGNGDNHLKNISFLVDARGIEIAPPYDLLCTAAYETRSLANEAARWPHTSLALTLGDATTFGSVTRRHATEAGQLLGLNAATATRELDRLVKAVPAAADRLLMEVEANVDRDVAASPEPEVTRGVIAGELRLLRAVRHIVIADMVNVLG